MQADTAQEAYPSRCLPMTPLVPSRDLSAAIASSSRRWGSEGSSRRSPVISLMRLLRRRGSIDGSWRYSEACAPQRPPTTTFSRRACGAACRRSCSLAKNSRCAPSSTPAMPSHWVAQTDFGNLPGDRLVDACGRSRPDRQAPRGRRGSGRRPRALRTEGREPRCSRARAEDLRSSWLRVRPGREPRAPLLQTHPRARPPASNQHAEPQHRCMQAGGLRPEKHPPPSAVTAELLSSSGPNTAVARVRITV